MKPDLLRLPVLIVAVLLGSVSESRAIEFVTPTPEQEARCNAIPEIGRNFCARGYAVAGLKFPDAPEELGFFASVEKMAIYKPEGNGPFPALVLLHTCGPIREQHFRYWVKQTLDRGYVAFVVDSFGQRGLANGTCQSVPKGFLPGAVRSRDAFEALDHLGRFAFVDSARDGAMGFSFGVRMVYLVASKGVADIFAPGGKRFAAGVALYGQCFNRELGINYIRSNLDRPLLALLGDQDSDGDPTECVPRLQAAKDEGAPVEWHVFPAAGHAWDNPLFRPPRRISQVGTKDVLFAYDADVTEPSRDRAFAFLDRLLKGK